ncbi:MAG: RagB/SusD family nutrient uptake outer membrane protein, partial [Bacteroidia bacterium]|nr:RagB/SusD family nutrient uptake outer membrane protein [Bacteroidia bacterium]
MSLVGNFADNFSVRTENNPESLFEYQAASSGNDNVWLSNDNFQSIGTFSSYWGFYENHWSMFGKQPYIATDKLLNAFEEGDPRRALTLNPDNKQIQKYWTQNEPTNTGVGSFNNPRILRYADVLLLWAEALNETGDQAGAIALINQVRTRAR